MVVFESFKHWHKIAVNNVTRTGYTKFNKTEFLNAIDSIRAKTFKKNTILLSWRKSGIFPYNPNVVLTKLRENEPYKERYQREQNSVTPSPPCTPESRTPNTPNIVRRLQLQIDEFQALPDLSSSYKRRFNKIAKGAVALGLRGKLYEEQLSHTEAAQKAREQRKKKGRKQIQKGGVLYVEEARLMVRSREMKAAKEADEKRKRAESREKKKAEKAAKAAEAQKAKSNQ